MEGVHRVASRGLITLRGRSLFVERRALHVSSREHIVGDRKFVRIAGPTAYATRDDVIEFMRKNDVDVSRLVEAKRARLRTAFSSTSRGSRDSRAQADAEESPEKVDERLANSDGAVPEVLEDPLPPAVSVAEGSAATVPDMNESKEQPEPPAYVETADSVPPLYLGRASFNTFMNHSTWIYETESYEDANDIASKLTGKVCGMKLVRVAAVDSRIAKEAPGLPAEYLLPLERPGDKRSPLNVLAPSSNERDRSLLLTGLPAMLYPRTLWAFFGAYDVADVRLLRRFAIASVVFRDVSEMERAFRDRGSMTLNGQDGMKISYHA